jgi:kynurenine formamidase
MHVRTLSATAILTLAFASTFSLAKSEDANALWKIQKTLASKKYVDLTHEFEPGIPRWPGFPDKTRKTIYWYDKRPDTLEVGFFSELFIHVGQWGTHVDPPAHFIKGPKGGSGFPARVFAILP